MSEQVPLFLDIECEPWPDDGDLHLWSAKDDGDDSYHVATISGDVGTEERNATARRMVACWNACEDLPTKTLEDGSVLGLLGAANEMLTMLQRVQEIYGVAALEQHGLGFDISRLIAKATGQEVSS